MIVLLYSHTCFQTVEKLQRRLLSCHAIGASPIILPSTAQSVLFPAPPAPALCVSLSLSLSRYPLPAGSPYHRPLADHPLQAPLCLYLRIMSLLVSDAAESRFAGGRGTPTLPFFDRFCFHGHLYLGPHFDLCSLP